MFWAHHEVQNIQCALLLLFLLRVDKSNFPRQNNPPELTAHLAAGHEDQILCGFCVLPKVDPEAPDVTHQSVGLTSACQERFGSELCDQVAPGGPLGQLGGHTEDGP